MRKKCIRDGDITSRMEIVDLIPVNARKILDVGCGYGGGGYALKQQQVCEVIGIECDEERNKEASRKIDKVINEDIENLQFKFEEKYFDCIIFADVLEHLRDPLETLLQYKEYLNDNGKIIVSIPNVRQLSVLFELLFLGDWKYREFGLLDKGHLRFFTKKSACRLFEQAGLRLLSMDSIFSIKGSKYINILSLGILRNFLTAQYVCCLEKWDRPKIKRSVK